METINLDINRPSANQAIFCKQDDVGRKFKVIITENAQPYKIPEHTAFSVWYSGSSGEGNYSTVDDHSAFSVEGNTVTIELIVQMLRCRGGGRMCLVMNSANGNQLGMWNIDYIVEGVPGIGSSEAQEYFTAFSDTAAQAKKALDEITTKVDGVRFEATDDGSGIITLAFTNDNTLPLWEGGSY
jgi:hypothetical protein